MIWAKLGSMLMFMAIVLGAFGAHALRGKLTDHYMDVFKTGVLYHMIHALSLFIVAWMSTQTADAKVAIAGYFLLAGIVLFSGSLYVISLTPMKWFGAITPIGGVSFLIGWLVLLCLKW